MYAPLNYSQINFGAGTYSPSPIKPCNNQSYWFWFRALFQRAESTLIFNLPEEWQGAVKDFFTYCLFRSGYVGVFDTPEFGKSFQPGGLSGYDFYYQPRKFIVANPLLSREFEIGKDCELIKLTPDYMGIFDIISYYAEKLSTLDTAINMSIINNKFAFILGAKNKSTAAALKKVLDKVNSGEPAVIVDKVILDEEKTDPWQIFQQEHLKNQYITTDQLRDFQTILNNFDCEIGIPTIPYEKKERMVTDEANSRIIDSTSRSLVWFDTLTHSIDKVNKMFGLGISVELRYDPEKLDGEEETEDVTE